MKSLVLLVVVIVFVAGVASQTFTAGDCQSFCNTTVTACGGIGSGYYGSAGCIAWCNTLVAANLTGLKNDTSGNTMGCRFYHAGVASTNATFAAEHCVHVAPLGGAVCVDGSSPQAILTSSCTTHCLGAVAACPGSWPNASMCVQGCVGAGGLGFIGFFPTQNYTDHAGDNSINCRTLHTGAVFDLGNNATSRAAHCPHTAILGGGVCGNVTTAANIFCTSASLACAGTFPYSSIATCIAAALQFDNSNLGTAYGANGATGNSMACRMAQLGAGNCANVGTNSTTCSAMNPTPSGTPMSGASHLTAVAILAILVPALVLAAF